MKRGDPFELKPEESIRDAEVDVTWRTQWIDTMLDDPSRPSIGERHFAVKKTIAFPILFGTLLGFFIVLGGRLLSLQIVHGSTYRDLAEENRIRISVVDAQRGLIFDRNGEWLVRNVPSFVLTAIPGDLPIEGENRNRLLESVAKVVHRPAEDLQAALEGADPYSFNPIPLVEQVEYSDALNVEIQSPKWPGISLKQTTRRELQELSSLSHVVGYVSTITPEEIKQAEPGMAQGTDKTGRSGLERFYESLLRGLDGKQQIEVNALGKEQHVIASRSPEHGSNLVLSLDRQLQEAAEQALQRSIDENQATGGSVIAMDPRDGQVLALVSLPAFDANLFSRGGNSSAISDLFQDPGQPLFFRAVSGEYPSGSTIKPLIGAAALAEGIVKPETSYMSSGGIRIGEWFFPDWKSGGHGATNIRKAIAESVNTYFYLIGGGDEQHAGLGVDRIVRYAKAFGFSTPLQIDLPQEGEGFLPSKSWKEETKGERWYIGDTYHLSIGQGDILVTPLQIAAMTMIIANNGTLFRPHLVHQTTSIKGDAVQTIEPMIIRSNIVPISAITPIQQGLRDAILKGSGRRLSNFPIEIAGKTGTAQFGNVDKTHAWFTSYAPYSSPEIVVTVLVEQGGEGHAAALPVAEAVYLAYFGLEAEKSKEGLAPSVENLPPVNPD